eukprot:gene35180-10678_t
MGPLILQALPGDVQKLVMSTMELQEIGCADGCVRVMALLDERFRRPDDARAFEAFEGVFFTREGSLDQFVDDFEAKWRQAERLGAFRSMDAMRAHLLIKQANLPKTQKSQLFLQLDSGRVRKAGEQPAPLDFERVKTMLRAIADAHALPQPKGSLTGIASEMDLSDNTSSGGSTLAMVAAAGKKVQGSRCAFCGLKGHNVKMCFKKDRKIAEAAKADPSSPLHEKAKSYLERLDRLQKRQGGGERRGVPVRPHPAPSKSGPPDEPSDLAAEQDHADEGQDELIGGRTFPALAELLDGSWDSGDAWKSTSH